MSGCATVQDGSVRVLVGVQLGSLCHSVYECDCACWGCVCNLVCAATCATMQVHLEHAGVQDCLPPVCGMYECQARVGGAVTAPRDVIVCHSVCLCVT